MLAAILAVRGLQAQTGADEKTIRDMLNEEVNTWNASDALGFSRHFTDDCTFTNIRGIFTKDRKRSNRGTLKSSATISAAPGSSRKSFL
jgi:uncharacterized protein (TIGR02246 family)